MSGFLLDVQPWERPVVTVLPAVGEPFMLLNELSPVHVELARERGSLWVDDVRLYVEHPRQANRLPTVLELSGMLRDALAERRSGDHRAGRLRRLYPAPLRAWDGARGPRVSRRHRLQPSAVRDRHGLLIRAGHLHHRRGRVQTLRHGDRR